jgi:predicted  nucleic acid-binding Zn-ribbon protein
MDRITYTEDELGVLLNEMETRFDILSDPVKPRKFIVDFSQPSAANKWIQEMRGSGPTSGPLFRPAGIIGQIKYYTEGQKKEEDHHTYQFLLSSQNKHAAITDLLNYECRTPKPPSEETPLEDDSAYQSLGYFDIVQVLRDHPEEISDFVRNTLRLIKGTSFSKREKGLTGLPETINCALDFVAILLTAECLRDPCCKYLVVSEFYKLKKGEIDLTDLFHPLYGRYIPARVTKANFLEKSVGKWPTEPKKKSRIPSKFSKGGAQQMREVLPEQIFEHFFDEEMQNHYQTKVKPLKKEVTDVKKWIEDIEKDQEKIRKKYADKQEEVIRKAFEMLQAEIEKIEKSISSITKRKQEIEKKKAEYDKAIEGIQASYEEEATKWRKEELVKAKQKLEELTTASLSGFFKWVISKFGKAQKYCQKTDQQ